MAKHGKIKDNGEYFIINPASRKITVPHAHKSIGAVGDHNSEQITFECPQMVDGHDISQCASRYVTWFNVNGEVGHDELNIVQVEQGKEGKIYLTWTIRNGLTVAKGIVQFSVHFEDIDEDGTTLYRWSTATCKDCDILDSVNAVLGAYQSVYVAGDTLVFEDYNIVKDGVLKLETNGVIPEGTLKIEANGKYVVGEYAEVDVEVDTNDKQPVITVTEGGKVTATEGGATSEIQLSNEHNSAFLPENIKAGVNIFGVDGSYNPIPEVRANVRIRSRLAFNAYMFYSGSEAIGEIFGEFSMANGMGLSFGEEHTRDDDGFANRSANFSVVKNSLITIVKYKNSDLLLTEIKLTNAELLQEMDVADMTVFVIKPIGANVKIDIDNTKSEKG